MKKYVSLIMALILCLSIFTGCGEEDIINDKTSNYNKYKKESEIIEIVEEKLDEQVNSTPNMLIGCISGHKEEIPDDIDVDSRPNPLKDKIGIVGGGKNEIEGEASSGSNHTGFDGPNS